MFLQEQESSQVAELRAELESSQQQCVELLQQVQVLQEQADSAFKNLESSNKALICELEEKLRREKQDCQELRKRLMVSVSTGELHTLLFILRKVTQRKFCSFMFNSEMQRCDSTGGRLWTFIMRVFGLVSLTSGCKFSMHTLKSSSVTRHRTEDAELSVCFRDQIKL